MDRVVPGVPVRSQRRASVRGAAWRAAALWLAAALALTGLVSLPGAAHAASARVTSTVEVPPGVDPARVNVSAQQAVTEPSSGVTYWLPVEETGLVRDGSSWRWTMSLPAGTYVFALEDYDSLAPTLYYPAASSRDEAIQVEVDGTDRTLAPMRMTLFSSLGGVVTVPTGKYVGRVEVVAHRRYIDGNYAAEGSTDVDPDESNYWILGLPPGTYRVWFGSSEAGVSGGWWAGKGQPLAETRDDGVDVELPHSTDLDDIDAALLPGGTISGRVLDVTGKPAAAGLRVSAYSPEVDEEGGQQWRPVASAPVAEDGTYAVEGLAGGTYRVGVVDADRTWIPTYYPSAATAAEGSDVHVAARTVRPGVDMTIDRGARLLGSAVLPSGSAPAGVEAALYERQDGAWVKVRSTRLASDRSFVIDDVPEGTYRLGLRDDSGVAGAWFHGGSSLETAADLTLGPGVPSVVVRAELAEAPTTPGTPTTPTTPGTPTTPTTPGTPTTPTTPGTPTTPTTPGTNQPGTRSPAVRPPLKALKVRTKPRLKGTAKAGRRLAVTRGSFSPRTVSVKYRWYLRKKNGRVLQIKSATAAKLRLKKSWAGRRVRAKVTVSRPGHRTTVITTGWSRKIRR